MKRKKKRIILSVSIIAGNEEHWITPIIDDCKSFADEIVVLCSGSDRTKEIAAEKGCKVHDFKWIKDYAAARNECLKHCVGRYVMWVDCDDRLIPSEQRKIRILKDAWLTKPADMAFKLSLADKNEEGPAHFLDQIRIFPKLNDNMWHGKIHETVVGATAHLVSRETNIWVYHEGYQNPEMLGAKIRRNVELLKQEVKRDDKDAVRLSYLGASYSNVGKVDEAWKTMVKAFEMFHKSKHKPSKFMYLMRLFPILLKKKMLKELWGCMEMAAEVYPDDPQPYAVMARIAAIKKNYDESIRLADKALKLEYVDDAGLPVIGNVHKECRELRKMVEREATYQYAQKIKEEAEKELESLKAAEA